MIELETVSMEEERLEDDKTTEETFTEVANTVCDHELAPAPSDPNSNMHSVQCTKCSHGASYDPNELELVDGKLVKKETV